QLAVRDGRLLRVPATSLSDLVRTLAPASTRALPLDFGTRSSYLEERRVRLPDGWVVDELADGGTAESPFGTLRVEVRQEGRELAMRTEFALRRDRIAPQEYSAFRRWVHEADAILRQRTTLAPGGGAR